MNPMVQALQQSRQSNPVSSSGPMPGNPAPQPSTGNPGDMEKYWSMIQDMSAKLDKLIEAVSGQKTGKTVPEDTQNDGNEAKETKGAY